MVCPSTGSLNDSDTLVNISKNGIGFATVYRFISPQSSLPIDFVVGFGASFALNFASSCIAAQTANPMLGVAMAGATAEGLELKRMQQLALMIAGAAGGYFI